MDYIKHWKLFASIYTLFSLTILIFFFNSYSKVFSEINFIFVLVIICLSYLFYSFQSTSTSETEPMSRYDLRYLTVKVVEVLLQQLVIIGLFFLTHQNVLLFASLFVLLHLHLFFYKTLLSALLITLFAFFLALVFYFIYSTFGMNGLGLSYGMHMAIYLFGGKGFKYVYNH